MIRRSLDAIREKIRAEMQAGAEFCWRDVLARADDASNAWAHDTLRNWHRAGETHVVRWVRGRQGPAMPVYRWGAGNDATRPKPLTNSQKSRRWRKANPDLVAAHRTRVHEFRVRMPRLDPVLSALLKRRRLGDPRWLKQAPVVIALCPDDHLAHPVPEV